MNHIGKVERPLCRAPFQQVGSTDAGQYMTGALRVKGPGDAEPVRYNAVLKEGGAAKSKTYTNERRFVEEKGSRYIEAQPNQLGPLQVPSTGTVVLALLLNFMLVVVWLVACWLVMRFSLGHSLMFTAVLAVITMLALMPVLFKQNRAAPAPGPTAPAKSAAVYPAGPPARA